MSNIINTTTNNFKMLNMVLSGVKMSDKVRENLEAYIQIEKDKSFAAGSTAGFEAGKAAPKVTGKKGRPLGWRKVHTAEEIAAKAEAEANKTPGKKGWVKGKARKVWTVEEIAAKAQREADRAAGLVKRGWKAGVKRGTDAERGIVRKVRTPKVAVEIALVPVELTMMVPQVQELVAV